MQLRGLEIEQITRRVELEDDIPAGGTPTWTIHTHPFNTLPLLKSHLHPKYVIFDAGRKLGVLAKSDTHFVNKTILAEYGAWKRELPDITQEDPSYFPR